MSPGVTLAIGVLLVLFGAWLSTLTMEAAPGQPPRRPMRVAVARAIDLVAALLVIVGLVLALTGGVLVSVEVSEWRS